MAEFEFNLIYALPTGQDNSETYLDALFESGCDDALPGIGLPGRIAFAFVREADSAQDAVLSAISDVERAIDGAILLEIKPDYVGASEIAEIAGCSRQNVQKQLAKIATRLRPVHSTPKLTLYHLASMRNLLETQTSLTIDPRVYEVAEIALKENSKLLEL